jgi:hypothetical protein
MTKYSRVRTVLSVGHLDHGHTYTVWAKFRFGPDARMLQRHLENVTGPLDHTRVSDHFAIAENLAEHIGEQLPGCIHVELRRDPEGFVGEWEASPHKGGSNGE